MAVGEQNPWRSCLECKGLKIPESVRESPLLDSTPLQPTVLTQEALRVGQGRERTMCVLGPELTTLFSRTLPTWT